MKCNDPFYVITALVFSYDLTSPSLSASLAPTETSKLNGFVRMTPGLASSLRSHNHHLIVPTTKGNLRFTILLFLSFIPNYLYHNHLSRGHYPIHTPMPLSTT